MQFILTCPHNTAQIAKKELSLLGYQARIVTSTSLAFEGDEAAIARVNLRSRIGNKLFLEVGNIAVRSFDDLFSGMTKIEWGKYIVEGTPITVQAMSKNHILSSTPALQGVGKKAIIRSLTGSDEALWDERKAQSDVEVLIHLSDNREQGPRASILINTTGSAMHNRGYRTTTGDAPIKENLAAYLVLTSGWKFSTPLVDPFCGSGTLLIEAAMIAKNIAPGHKRMSDGINNTINNGITTGVADIGFAFQSRSRYDTTHTQAALDDATRRIMLDKPHTIIGYDHDEHMISTTQENARQAGVYEYITVSRKEFIPTEKSTSTSYDDIVRLTEQGTTCVVTNPPYGDRLSVTSMIPLYQKIISLYEDNKHFNGSFITSAIATTNSLIQPSYRKTTEIYNGPLECLVYKIARL